jgi:HD-GYP domain-containing protein (c-di-GMP phosphodiesterase class II)
LTITLDFNSSRWIRSQSNTVEKELEKREKSIADILDYDICASLIFNESRNIAINKSIFTKDPNFPKDIMPHNIFLQKDPHNLLNELIHKKKIIEHHHQHEDCPMLNGIKSEVFIPIFNPHGLTMVLIGCIYLGSYEYKEFPLTFISEDERVNESISDISKLLTLTLVKFQQISNLLNMVNVFTDVLKHKDHFLPNHSYNVANWCKDIGMELGLTYEELDKLVLAGLLHDVGKTLIDDKILNKPGKLTDEEYEIIKRHPIGSYTISKNLLGHIMELSDIPDIVRHHHERYDGKGYPDGLKGEQISLSSYIIGISDAVDTMLSNRAYKKAMPVSAVINELYKNKGTQFHPDLVDIMVDKLTKAQKQFEKTLNLSISLSSLIISFKDDILILEGSLVKMGGYYIFKPIEESKAEEIDLSEILDIEMVVKDLNDLHHYQVKFEDFADNTFYISSLQLIPSSNTFNLLWDLEGEIYHPRINKEIPIEIVRIGGDALSFCLSGDLAVGIPYRKPLKVKVFFEDIDINISGNIMKGYNFGPYKYFDLHYTNIPDNKRDAIFRQLFKKQIQIRKAIAEYKY